MPNWNSIVHERLRHLGLGAEQRKEVVAELAGHLEDSYEQFRAQGIEGPEALRLTLKEHTDWQKLARKIGSAKHKEGVMNNRTKTLWLPGLVSLTAASTLLMGLERF